jgi:hypothetical protein
MKKTELQNNLQQEIDRVNKLADRAFTLPGAQGMDKDMQKSIHNAVRARDKGDVTDKILAVQELEYYL